MNNIFKKRNTKTGSKGFSLIEVVIYFGLLAIISTLVITHIISMFKNYGTVRSNQEIEYNAIAILDKLTRDVRDSESINVTDSDFDVAQGAISLRTSSTSEVLFYLENNKVKYTKDGILIGNLSTNSVTVSNFRIQYINASSTEAIKVDLNLEITPHLQSTPISKNFYTTILLRE